MEKFSELVKELPNADTLTLYRLSHALRTLYNEPRRIIDIAKQLHLGMTVVYFDAHAGNFQQGIITALGATDVSLTDKIRNLRYKHLSYAALDLSATPIKVEQPNSAFNDTSRKQEQPPSKPMQNLMKTRADFKVGDQVSFLDKFGITNFGVILRLNTKTASVRVGDDEGHWLIGFAGLRHYVNL